MNSVSPSLLRLHRSLSGVSSVLYLAKNNLILYFKCAKQPINKPFNSLVSRLTCSRLESTLIGERRLVFTSRFGFQIFPFSFALHTVVCRYLCRWLGTSTVLLQLYCLRTNYSGFCHSEWQVKGMKTSYLEGSNDARNLLPSWNLFLSWIVLPAFSIAAWSAWLKKKERQRWCGSSVFVHL